MKNHYGGTFEGCDLTKIRAVDTKTIQNLLQYILKFLSDYVRFEYSIVS